MIINDLSHTKEKSRLKIPRYVSHGKLSRVKNGFYNKNTELLKNNSGELSFKGSISNQSVYKAGELIKLVDKKFGKYILDSIEEVTSKTKNKYFVFDRPSGNLTIKPRTSASFFKESFTYPFTQMPLDILDFFALMLKKVGIKSPHEWSFLKKHREKAELRQKADAITGFFHSTKKLLPENRNVESLNPQEKKLIKEYLNKCPQKIFDINTGHYDVAKERSLNRVVSGFIPAFFLANDAYNLSRLINDDKNEANEESKIRFRQEITRVFSTAYLQLIMLGGFSRLVNNNKWASASLNVGIVLATEAFSRIINHKPITFISAKQAKILNEEERLRKENRENKKKDKLHYGKKEIDIVPDKVTSASADASKKHSPFETFENMITAKPKSSKQIVRALPSIQSEQSNRPNQPNPAEQKPKWEFFSFETLKTWVATSVGVGLAATYLRSFPAIEKGYKSFTGVFSNAYNKLTMCDAKISKKDFTELMARLREEGLGAQADFFENKYKDSMHKDVINLGKQERKLKRLVNLAVGPFKFMWETLALPFNLFKMMFSLVEPSTNLFFKKVEKTKNPFYPVAILNEKMHKLSKEDFHNYLYSNLLASFNDISKSAVSNADLAKLVKVFASTATSWFLIADNYNMVMIKSAGDNKEGAVQKGKERLVQRVSSIFYQTLLIDLFNNSFKTFYHNSLAGMSVITASCTLSQEILNRKAIGMPILPHSKEEIQQIEEKHNNQKGLVGAYYRFMSKLIGKKPISQRKTQTEQK